MLCSGYHIHYHNIYDLNNTPKYPKPIMELFLVKKGIKIRDTVKPVEKSGTFLNYSEWTLSK